MSSNTKRAIRERMAKTGETYSTARMHVLAMATVGVAEAKMSFCPYLDVDLPAEAPFSDDHVVPYAIGGGKDLVIRVSQKANSETGSGADAAFINSWFINWDRTLRGIEGQSGQAPTMELRGEVHLVTGSRPGRYRFSLTEQALSLQPEVAWGTPTDGKQALTISAGSEEEFRTILNNVNRKLRRDGKQPLDVDAAVARATTETTEQPRIQATGAFDVTSFHRAFVKMGLGIGHFVLGETYSRDPDADMLRTFIWEKNSKKRESIPVPGTTFPFGQDNTLNTILGYRDHHVLLLKSDLKLTFAALIFGKYFGCVGLGDAKKYTSKLRPGQECVWVVDWRTRRATPFGSLGAFIVWKQSQPGIAAGSKR